MIIENVEIWEDIRSSDSKCGYRDKEHRKIILCIHSMETIKLEKVFRQKYPKQNKIFKLFEVSRKNNNNKEQKPECIQQIQKCLFKNLDKSRGNLTFKPESSPISPSFLL